MCWNILKTQHSLCPASPSSHRAPRNSWCPGTPDCNNGRSPSPDHPSSHLPPPSSRPQAGLSLAMVVGLSFPGRLPCLLRPRKCLLLPQNASPPARSPTPHDPCDLLVRRSWALRWHETWLETLLPFLPSLQGARGCPLRAGCSGAALPSTTCFT